MRPIHQQLLCRFSISGSEVVAKPVRGGFEHGKRLHVGLLLRRVRAPRREGNLHVLPGVPGSLLDARAPAQDNQVSERDPPAAGLRAVEFRLDPLQGLQNLPQLGRVVHFPILLRREADARPVRPAAFVGATERCRRRPSGRNELGYGQSRCEDLALEVRDVLLPDQFMGDLGDGVLPQKRLRRDQ